MTAGEMPMHSGIGAWTRHGADAGKQQQEDQEDRPGRGHGTPTSRSPVFPAVWVVSFESIDHDPPHDVAAHQNRLAPLTPETTARIAAMPSHSGE
jgi:hypothetical protein